MKRALLVLIAAAGMFLAPISGHAALLQFFTTLDGPSEFPPVASPGTGFAQVVVDTLAHTMTVDAAFSGLIGTTTAAHIHCCVDPGATPPTVGVATTTPSFVGFPLGVTSGNFHSVLDLTMASSFRPGFITDNGGTVAGAEAALIAGLLAEDAYFNIHTTFAPGGEIRGFLQIPEPGTLTLFALGLGAGFITLRRRRSLALKNG